MARPSLLTNMVEIYSLADPDSGEVRYVGKANDSQKRIKRHILDSRRRNTPVYCWVRKLAAQGKIPTIGVMETCLPEDWPEAERRLIAHHHKGGRLLNLAEGGNEPFCSKEQRAINGRNTARSIHDDPRKKRIWEIKKGIGDNLAWAKKEGRVEHHNRIVIKLRAIALKYPAIWGCFSALKEIEA